MSFALDCINLKPIKTCSRCQLSKNEDEFYKDVQKYDGLRSDCKSCRKKGEEDRLSDPQELENKRSIARKSYRKRFKNKHSHHRNVENTYRKAKYDSDPEYRRKQIFAAAEGKRKRRESDPSIRAIDSARNRPNTVLKSKSKRFSHTLGCSTGELRAYLESLFQPGMTWENYGKWEVDHIYPLSVAYKEGAASFAKACHYTNLQPLWHEDHLTKTKSDLYKSK